MDSLTIPRADDRAIFLADLLDGHHGEIARLEDDVRWYRWCYEVTFFELARLRQIHDRQIAVSRSLRADLEESQQLLREALHAG